jgi:hypothetical protein
VPNGEGEITPGAVVDGFAPPPGAGEGRADVRFGSDVVGLKFVAVAVGEVGSSDGVE